MSQRTEQLAASIQRAVQTVLSRGLHDPRVRGLVSVVSVRVGDDMAQATIGVSVIPEEHSELSLHGIKHAAPYIQSQVAKMIKVRRLPRLVFRHDPSVKREAEIHAAINRATARTGGSESALPPSESSSGGSEEQQP